MDGWMDEWEIRRVLEYGEREEKKKEVGESRKEVCFWTKQDRIGYNRIG